MGGFWKGVWPGRGKDLRTQGPGLRAQSHPGAGREGGDPKWIAAAAAAARC